MNRSTSPPRISAQLLVGTRVFDAEGKKIGRVYEAEVGRCGDQLCVTTLLVGRRGLLTRFGWSGRPRGRRVPMERVASLHPQVTLRREKKD